MPLGFLYYHYLLDESVRTDEFEVTAVHDARGFLGLNMVNFNFIVQYMTEQIRNPDLFICINDELEPGEDNGALLFKNFLSL